MTNTAIFLVSLLGGVGKSTPLDRICIIGAFLAIILGYTYHSPLLMLIINCFVNTLGTLPTIYNAYHAPKDESTSAWTWSFVSSLCNVLAIREMVITLFIAPLLIFSYQFIRPLSKIITLT